MLSDLKTKMAPMGDRDCLKTNFLQSVGKHPTSLMQPQLRTIVERIGSSPDQYLTIGIDDSPTKRYGKHVEGANIHDNPTPGPSDNEWLYGHNWVTAAIVAPHSQWGTIALPILADMYVRKVGTKRWAKRGHSTLI